MTVLAILRLIGVAVMALYSLSGDPTDWEVEKRRLD